MYKRQVTNFTWNYDCQAVDFSERDEFVIKLVVDDKDECLFAHPDTLTFNLQLNLPPNLSPEIFRSDGAVAVGDYFKLEANINSLVNFDVRTVDADNDMVMMQAFGSNFDLAEFGASFPSASGAGNPGITSAFNWRLGCEVVNPAEMDSFRVYFVAEDIDRCELPNQDTLTVDIIVLPRQNAAPSLSFSSLDVEQEINGNTVAITYGNSFNLNIKGIDGDNDPLSLELLDIEGDPPVEGFTFENKVGRGGVSSPFIWTPVSYTHLTLPTTSRV